jgi:hypothetical protein
MVKNIDERMQFSNALARTLDADISNQNGDNQHLYYSGFL